MSKRPDSELSPAAQALIAQHLGQSSPAPEEHDRVWARVQHTMLPAAGVAAQHFAADRPASGGESIANPQAPAAELSSGVASPVQTGLSSAPGSAVLPAAASPGVGSSLSAAGTGAALKGGAAGVGIKTGILGTTIAKVALVVGISAPVAGTLAYQTGYLDFAEPSTKAPVSRVDPVVDGQNIEKERAGGENGEISQELARNQARLPLLVNPPSADFEAKAEGQGAKAGLGGEGNAQRGLELTPALLEQLRALNEIDRWLRNKNTAAADRALQIFSKQYPSTPFGSDLRALRLLLDCQVRGADAKRLDDMTKDPRVRRYWPRIRAACQKDE